MTFYGTLASAAGWIMPKKYFEKVGADGFKKHPIGLGPYKFVSMKPGIELVMEANEDYWRKVPSVKRLVFQSVPEATTRLAMLKRGEVDVAYLLEGQLGESIKNDPKLKLAFSGGIGTYLPRLLRHVGPEIAVGRPARAQGGEPRDRPQGAQRGRDARRLQAERQHRAEEHRIRAADRARSVRSGAGQEAAGRGRLSERVRRRRSLPVPPYFATGEAIVGYLGAVGIRTRLRTMERAAFFSALGAKKLKGVCFCSDRRSTATPRPACRRSCRATAAYAYGGWPDIDELYKQQLDRDRPRRSARRCCTRSRRSCTSARGSRRSRTISGRAGSGRASRRPR